MSNRREVKFNRILDAAVEAIAKAGYHECKVSQIANLAGVANGTIYLYFKSKEEILISVFQERMGDFIQCIRTQLLNCSDTRSRIEAIVRTHLVYMEDNRHLAIVTQLELMQSDDYVRKAIMQTIQEYFKLIEEVIYQGIGSSEVPDINVKVARQMIFGALYQATTDWVLSNTPKNLAAESEALLFLFEGALRLKPATQK